MMFYPISGHDTAAAVSAARAAGASAGRIETARFRNGELHLTVSPPPKGQHCVLIGTTAPPDTRIWELLLAAHTLKKEGADVVTALLPYVGYSRHDKNVAGESMAVAALGACLAAAGVDDVLTVDLHSSRDRDLLAVPAVSLPTAALFAEALRRDGWASGAVVIAPDNGAFLRCEELRTALGITAPVVIMAKHREKDAIVRDGGVGSVGERAVIVDDILDTGETLVTACEALRDAGVKEIAVAVTHGAFTGDLWERLPSLGVRRIYCTDTIPRPPHAVHEWIETVSAWGLIEGRLNAVQQRQ